MFETAKVRGLFKEVGVKGRKFQRTVDQTSSPYMVGEVKRGSQMLKE